MPQAGAKRVGDLFDLDRFRRDTGMVVVEVADLKQASPRRPLDGIGCYSTHFELAGEGNGDPAAFAVHRTEVSYLPMLTSVRKNAGEQISRTPDGFALTFDGLLQWTEDRAGRGAAAEEVIAERPSLVRPEENLLCLDDAYHLRTGRGIRIPFDGEDPVWLSIGRFLHFRPFWHRLADDYLRRVFQLDAPDPIPSYIAAQLDPHGASLTSTRSISDAIDRVRQRMASRTRKGVRVLVIGARDALENVEIDNTWTVFDHVALGTRWRDGVWAAPVLDMVVLSRAIGLVGTARDPASGLGALRVEVRSAPCQLTVTALTRSIQSWNGGPTDDMVA
jgi:hypothetical protein